MGLEMGGGVVQRCGGCGERRTRFVCSRCQKQRYCSRGCQKQNWTAHRSKCKASISLAASALQQRPPSKDGIRHRVEPRGEGDVKRLYEQNIQNLLKATAALREDIRSSEKDFTCPRRATGMTGMKDPRKELHEARLVEEKGFERDRKERKPPVPPRPRNAAAVLGQPPVPPRSSAARDLALAAQQERKMGFLSTLVLSEAEIGEWSDSVDARRTAELEKLVSATQVASTRRLPQMRRYKVARVEEESDTHDDAPLTNVAAEVEDGPPTGVGAPEDVTASHDAAQLASHGGIEGEISEVAEADVSKRHHQDNATVCERPTEARHCVSTSTDVVSEVDMATQLQYSTAGKSNTRKGFSTSVEAGASNESAYVADVPQSEETDLETERSEADMPSIASTFYGALHEEALLSEEEEDEDDSETMEEDEIAIIYEMPFFDEEASTLDVEEATISQELRAPIPDAAATASAVDFYRQQYQQSAASRTASSDSQLNHRFFASALSPRNSGSIPVMANRFNIDLGEQGHTQLSRTPSEPLRRTVSGTSVATKEERKSRRRSVLSKLSFSFDSKSKTKRDKPAKKEVKRKRKRKLATSKDAFQQALPDLAVVPDIPPINARAGQPTKRQFSQWLLQFGDQPIQNVMNAKHCNWLIEWVKSRTVDRRLVHQAAKFLCSLAYPDELVSGLQQLITRKKAAPALLLLAQQGVVAVHREVAKEDVIVSDTIARGAEGVIKLAKFSDTVAEDVVVKVCGEENINFDIENFRLEAALMSMLKHEHICPCLGASLKGPDYFVILPYLARGSLDKVLLDQGQELDLLAKVKIATKIAKGMAYIHQGDVLHRDLKSANVLLGKQMEVKIIDFGTSVVLLKRGQSLKKNMGTTAWIAPEVFVSSQYSKSADVYSFGIVLWEIVMRRCQPYEGVCKIFDLPTEVAGGLRPPLPEPGMCPEAVTTLMQQCWHPNPSARPSFTDVTRRLYDVYKKLFIAKSKGEATSTVA